jgi:cell division protein FtsN
MKRRAKRTPASLSLSQIATRLLIVSAVVGFFFLLVLLINHWYLNSLSNQPNATIAAPDTTQNPGEATSSEPATTSSSKDVNLTFYETLNQSPPSQTPPTLSPPENQQAPPSAPPAVASTPPVATTQPAPDASASAPGLSYTIQLGSFKSRQGADAIVEALTKQGFSPAVSALTTPQGETWYRVRVGSYPLREEAEKAAQELKQKGNFQPFVMSQTHPGP